MQSTKQRETKKEKGELWAISSFRGEIDEFCALLGHYAVYKDQGILEDGTDRLSRNVDKE
jgi:hypothetical protein